MEAMPGSATGKRSGIASKPNQTSRCRLLCPTLSAKVLPIDANCATAIRCTEARRLSPKGSGLFSVCGFLIAKVIEGNKLA
jgi:hypothetical protein